jgi:hypothetical protein
MKFRATAGRLHRRHGKRRGSGNEPVLLAVRLKLEAVGFIAPYNSPTGWE